jgi:polyhydroxybutyrate depolymerase
VAGTACGHAAYAIKAARAAAPEGQGESAGRRKCRWQREQLTIRRWEMRKFFYAITVFAALLTITGCTLRQAAITPTSPATNEISATSVGPVLTAQVGDSHQSIVVGGVERTYLLHIPPSYDESKTMPLIFVLHGAGGSAAGMKNTGMSEKADQQNFIVVYPNGTGEPSAWNNGMTPEISQPVDDIAFIRSLIDKFEQELRVDPKRIYVAGFSNGAMMTYRLGAELSDRLAAIAVVEGTIGTQQPDGSWLTIPNPAHPISVIVFHGEKDTNIPYNGGEGIRMFVRPVTDAVSFWIKSDGCALTPQTQTSPEGNIIHDIYSGCQNDTGVVLFTLVNGTHEWPKLQSPAAIAATDVILTFFARHPKP